MPVGEASVIIAISSKHRKESLEAVEFAIDTLKATVTIWKKVGRASSCTLHCIVCLQEIYEDGNSEWKQNKECFWTANNAEL